MPDGVEHIAPYVFYGRFNDRVSVVLSHSVKVIGKLSMPVGVSAVCIPKDIECIELYAFCYDGGVEEVFSVAVRRTGRW